MASTPATSLSLLLLLLLRSRGCLSAFFPGRIPHGENEYPELSGRMSVRAAASKCETDPECAGFTFVGTPELDSERHVAFFRSGFPVWTTVVQNFVKFGSFQLLRIFLKPSFVKL